MIRALLSCNASCLMTPGTAALARTCPFVITIGTITSRGVDYRHQAEYFCSAGDCLTVGTGLAQSVPTKVLDVFAATELLWPQSLMQTTLLGVATSGSTLRFVEQSVPALRDLQKVLPAP